MNEAVTRINLIKKIWVAYEQDQPGLLSQVTGQDQDEYNQMMALWRADLGLKEGSPMMVVRASGADQDEKHTAQLRHETFLPLKTKIEDTKAKIEAVTTAIEASHKQANLKILGKKRQITMPNGEKHDAQYAIVELDTILASHNEETFSDTKGYPRNSLGNNLNDRNYATDKGAQQLVEEYARNLNPDLVIALTSTPDGTPIITPDGIVVSGNNRTMSLKLARKKYGTKWREYQATLQNESDVFGFDQSDLDNLAEMTAPVLVRIDSDFGDLTTTNMAKYNASSMKGKSPVDRAAELATTLREQILCETNIPKIIGDFDTLSDFYADRSAVKRMVSAMQQCSVLNEQDMPAYVENGYFTEDGKTLLETILASLILEPDTLRIANRDGVRSFRQAIVNALPALIANKNLDASAILIPHINAAIRYQGEVIASGLGWENFVNQVNMFSDDRADCNTVYINRLMNEGQRVFRDAIRKYNDSQAQAGGNALFAAEVVSPDEAFKGYIIGRLPKEVVQRVQRYCKPQPQKTEPQFIPAIYNLGDHFKFERAGEKITFTVYVVEKANIKSPLDGDGNYQPNYKVEVITYSDFKSQPGREAISKVSYYYSQSQLTETLKDYAEKWGINDKTKTVKLRLKLLEKSVDRLDGDKKKLAETRIKLLTKYLSK